jgi:xanthine dehydrogenase molybdenum-binding subunit
MTRMSEGFRPRVARKHVGTYRPKIDGWEKASGRAEYLDDIGWKNRFPGMLHAKVLRSPYANARILSLDTAKAEKLAGVMAVITYQDPQISSLKPTNSGWTPFFTSSYDRMMWPTYRDRRILSDRVRWVGDEAGVVVAAESPQIADEALSLVDVEWEVLPFVLDPVEAMEPEAPVIHPEISPASNVLPPSPYAESPVFIEKGDTDKAFAEADVVVEVNSDFPNSDHSCLGTRGCLMQWSGDKLTCWTSYYQADQTRMHLTQMLGLPLHKVRVINPYIGASMGRGNTGEQAFFIFTALLAQRTGRPVLFQHTRREDFHDTRNRVIYDCTMGAKRDGTITGVYCRSICDSGAYADHSMAAVEFCVREFVEATLAHIPSLKMETYCVYTNKIPGGVMRGIGNNQVNLVFGLALDELAEKLDMDPIDLAVKNFGHEWGSVPDESLEAVLREGARRIGWEKRHKPGEGQTFDDTKKRGIGFSFHNSWHAAWQEVPRGHIQVSVKVNPDCTVVLDAPTAETGVGSNTCNVLACADALSFLGISPEDIQWISNTDTERGLKDQVQTDSGVSYCQAEVMPTAGAMIKAKILELAGEKMERAPDDLDVRDGVIFSKETEEQMTVAELFWEGDLVPILGTASQTLPDQVTGTPFMGSFAEVEVDTETGEVTVLKVVVVHDCGTVMFASGAEAQQLGGQPMALGETLTEELIHDEATGVPLNFNWIDYKIQTMADYPDDVEPVLMEVWRGAGEYGACGIGESVTTCTPRAVANAIYNATGVRIDHLPITPDRLLEALAKLPQDTASEVTR